MEAAVDVPALVELGAAALAVGIGALATAGTVSALYGGGLARLRGERAPRGVGARRAALGALAVRVPGLAPSPEGALAGSVRGVEVAVRLGATAHGSTRVEAGPVPKRLRLRPRSRGRTGLGDPAFDAVVRVKGDVAAALARLDLATRRALAPHLAAVEVRKGRVRWEVSRLEVDPAALERAVRAVVAVATALDREVDVAAGLVARATEDPCAGVRASALALLIDVAPDEVPRLLREASGRGGPEGALADALAQVEAGDPRAVEAVARLAREATTTPVRAWARRTERRLRSRRGAAAGGLTLAEGAGWVSEATEAGALTEVRR